jgi:GNAT superfamily N-acetyltransferase
VEIIEYNYDTRIQYSNFIRKYNKSKCLHTLNRQTFSIGKKIYLVLKPGFLKKYKIIGYTIIYEDLNIIYYSNDISKKYNGESNTIFISDFIIDHAYRKQGTGKLLARYLIEDVYKYKNIILQPDRDGYWFWIKFGFQNDNISKHETWILKR